MNISGKLSALDCRCQDAVAEWLGENQLITGLRTRVGEKEIGMRFACDRETVLELRVDYSVTADDECISLVDLFLTSGKNSAQHFQWQLARRKRNDVERR